MNELGTVVLWLAVQVTLLAVIAGLLYATVVRRGPVAATFVAVTSLGGVVGLTVLAFLPCPHAWSWHLQTGSPQLSEPDSPPMVVPSLPGEQPTTAERVPDTDIDPGESASGLTWSLDSLRRAWERLDRDRVTPPERGVDWRKAIAGIFLAGTGLSLLRVLFALWAVHACRRRSRPITEASLNHLVETLQLGLHCPRPVELRECPDLTTAATVGWLRPVVLLPPDWRDWSETEMRAVLAHELAHVQRRDYLAGLVARISVALHFYHPLVYWLAGRLPLQQELAADALGAMWAGGRGPYLAALAKLALRQADRAPGWPARAFLPARGTLMRRIQMLRTNHAGHGRPLPWTIRALTVGLLVAVAIGAAALRGSSPSAWAQAPANRGPGPAPAQAAEENFLYFGDYRFGVTLPPTDLTKLEREPFDLSWFPADGLGVLAVRPAAVLKRPGMERLAEELNREVTREFKKLGMSQGLGLPLEDLDQVLGKFLVLHEAQTEDGKKEALVAGLYMLRTVQDFDWKKLLYSNPPELTAISYRGTVYYKPIGGAVPGVAHNRVLPFLGKDMCYFIPDARTLIVDTEANLRRLIKRGPARLPECVWAEGWARVERSLVAVALDCRDGRLLDDKAKAEGPKPPELAILLNIEQAVWGIDGPDDFRMQGWATCATEQTAAATRKHADTMLSMIRLEHWLGQWSRKPASSDLEDQCRRFVADLLKNTRIEHRANEVGFRSEATLKSTTLLESLIKELK